MIPGQVFFFRGRVDGRIRVCRAWCSTCPPADAPLLGRCCGSGPLCLYKCGVHKRCLLPSTGTEGALLTAFPTGSYEEPPASAVAHDDPNSALYASSRHCTYTPVLPRITPSRTCGVGQFSRQAVPQLCVETNLTRGEGIGSKEQNPQNSRASINVPLFVWWRWRTPHSTAGSPRIDCFRASGVGGRFYMFFLALRRLASLVLIWSSQFETDDQFNSHTFAHAHAHTHSRLPKTRPCSRTR